MRQKQKFHNNNIVLCSTHIPQVKDEAVSLVKAVPADRDFSCPHTAATLDLEQPLDNHFVCDDMLKPGSHASFLGDINLKGFKY